MKILSFKTNYKCLKVAFLFSTVLCPENGIFEVGDGHAYFSLSIGVTVA